MIARSLLMLGLAALMFGCGPAAPETAAPQEEQPTVDIPATVAAVVAVETGQPTNTHSAVASKATIEPTDTPQPTDTPIPAAPTLKWIATPEWMAKKRKATVTPPSQTALDLTQGWLMEFTHHDEEYINQARSAFSYVEDSRFCDAAEKFAALAATAQDRDGERLVAATYNAGVLYVLVHSAGQKYCFRHDDFRRKSALSNGVKLLESTWRHRPHTGYDPEIAFLLGAAYFDQAVASPYGPIPGARESAVEFLCLTVELELYRDRAASLLDQLDASCSDPP